MENAILIRSFFQKLKYSLLHFVYPSRCLHCEEHLGPHQSLFCSGCAQLLELINPEERCPTCFDYVEGARCHNCRHGHSLFCRMGAAFDYIGPAASLIKKFKYSNQPHLAKGVGAFLVAQLDRLQWPLPDAIIPVPLSFTHWMDRGYNQSLLLAEQMGSLLDIPVWDILKRSSGDYSQAGLLFKQRQSLTGHSFQLKRKYSLEDKTLLLVDDVMTTGATLKRCAEVLADQCPANLYALAFCKAIYTNDFKN